VGRDRGEFVDFARAESGRLLRTAYLLVGNPAVAEDLVQDVLERLYVAWPRVDEPRKYANRALVNQSRNHWRRMSRRHEVELSETAGGAVADQSAQSTDRMVLLRALAQLSSRQRSAVVLRYLADLSEADVAEAMGCSTGAVKSHTARAIARLRTELSGLFDEASCELIPRRTR
jgi:RNA polymerase sigma-70 factor (sigma-E family)